MRYAISRGPFYPGWPGVLRIDLIVEDGIVQAAEAVTLRPRPPRAEDWAGLSPEEGLAGAEHLCAASATAHALAYCQALERIAGVEIPPRARYLRVLLAELERISSHLLTASQVLQLAGLPNHASALLELREETLAAGQQLTGQRFFAGLVVPGGLQRDLPDLSPLDPLIRRLKGQAYRLAHRIIVNRGMVAPLIGAGLLTMEQAEGHGVGGPALRATEGDHDTRRDQPYAAYGDLELQVITQGGGDVFSRWMVFVLEVFESLRLLEALLPALPQGPVRAGVAALPAGEDQSRVEAPAGPLVVRVQVDDAGKIVGLWRTPPTPAHLTVLPQTLQGQRLELIGVIVASWGLCPPCLLR
jgi:Ni,Fe-hydrogenase III large subunit